MKPLGELGEEPGAGGRVLLVEPDSVPFELLGLHAQPRTGARGAPGLVREELCRQTQLTRVAERLGEAVRDRLAQGLVGLGLLQRGPELVDRRRGLVQEVGGSEFEQDLGAVLHLRGLTQGTRQVAARGIGSARGEALARGLAQLLYDPRVAFGVHLQQMAGGGRGTLPVVDHGLGGHPVHGHAHTGRNRAVHGGGDERVEELHDLLAPYAREDGQDACGPQPVDGLGGLCLTEGGHATDDAEGDRRTEHGGRPGEPDGGRAELFEPVDQAAALDRGSQVAQLGDVVLVRLQPPVAALHDQLDHLEGVSAGDRPAFAAEHVVRVLPEGVAHDARDGARGQGSQLVRARPLASHEGAQSGGVGGDLVGPAGHHDQHGQFLGARREGGEPAQGLRVRPVRVVDDQHDGGVAYR
ncbi:hypothetical protein ACFXJJ_05930 [Streptomyces sp. NPDC059233]